MQPPRRLDAQALELFASKGAQHPGAPAAANLNGLKVRRVMQLIADLSTRPFDQLRIFDLACGEGVYAIEAALRGAEVVAIDGRLERMREGAAVAARHGLQRLRFEQADIRQVDAASHGTADVVLFLGILYHLDAADIFPVLRNLHGLCSRFAIVDTHVALAGDSETEMGGRLYPGSHFREHAENDSPEVRQARLQASLDNSSSFWPTRDGLFRLLSEAGFSAVLECAVPLEPGKPPDRVTVVACKGEPVALASYPWVNAVLRPFGFKIARR